MRRKPDELMQDIVDKHLCFEYKNGIIFYEGKAILEDDYTKFFAPLLTRPTPNTIRDVVNLIKDFCSVKLEDCDLWDLFRQDTNKRFAKLEPSGKTPLIFDLYDNITAQKLIKIATQIVQGKSKYMFVLHGVSGAGKSLFIDCMIDLFGTYQTVKQMTDFNGQFTLDGVQNKLLVQCNDLGQEQVTPRASGRFKQICDGSKVNIERKSKKEEIIKPWFNMLFGTNLLPQFNVLDAGNLTRGAYVYFDKKITLRDYHATKKTLQSEQHLCDLWHYLNALDIDNNYLEHLQVQWRNAQLARLKCVVASKKQTYLNYCNLCVEHGIPAYNSFEFEDAKAILFGVSSDRSFEQEVQATIDNDELPF